MPASQWARAARHDASVADSSFHCSLFHHHQSHVRPCPPRTTQAEPSRKRPSSLTRSHLFPLCAKARRARVRVSYPLRSSDRLVAASPLIVRSLARRDVPPVHGLVKHYARRVHSRWDIDTAVLLFNTYDAVPDVGRCLLQLYGRLC